MIKIYLSQLNDGLHPPSAEDPVRRTKRASSASAKLLQEALRDMRISDAASADPVRIEKTELGKPFFPDLPDIHFNLSHSGSWIACAFSDREVGLDLQEHAHTQRNVLRIAKRYFTPEEHEALAACAAQQERDRLFFRFWTIKEAYLKYTGFGLHEEMDSFLPAPLPLMDTPLPSLQMTDPAARFPGLPGQAACSLRGTIRVVKDRDQLLPAEYTLLPAPEGYTMAVCAESLPQDLSIQFFAVPES